MNSRRIRVAGAFLVGAGLICNQWVLASIFSRDGSLESYSLAAIWAFQTALVGFGLLLLFRRMQLLINVTITIVVVVITLFLADLAARPLLVDMLYYRPEERFKNRWPPFPALSKFKSNVEYSGEVIGDIAAISGSTEAAQPHSIVFETDEFGYRNSFWDPDRPLDLIILGDSFGSGVGVTQERTFSSILSREYGLNVCNLSMPGYNLWHEMLCLKVELPRLKTDDRTVVVWLVFSGNDLDTPYGNMLDPVIQTGSLKRLKVRLNTFKRRSPIIQLLERIKYGDPERASKKAKKGQAQGFQNFLFYSPYLEPALWTEDQVVGHHNYAMMKSVVGEMAGFASEKGLAVMMVVIPDKSEIYRWILEDSRPWETPEDTSGFSRALKSLCESANIGYLDLKPPFLQKAKEIYEDSGEFLWWRDDTHWNENGHALAASIVNEFILNKQ